MRLCGAELTGMQGSAPAKQPLRQKQNARIHLLYVRQVRCRHCTVTAAAATAASAATAATAAAAAATAAAAAAALLLVTTPRPCGDPTLHRSMTSALNSSRKSSLRVRARPSTCST